MSISNHISRKVLAEHSKIRSLSNLSGSPDPANVRCCSESLSAPHGLPKRLACLAISARVKMPIPTSWKKKGEREKSNSTAPHTPGGGPQPADLETRASQQQHGVQCRISPTAALIGCCLWYVAPASYEFTKFCFFFLLWFDLIRCLFYLIFCQKQYTKLDGTRLGLFSIKWSFSLITTTCRKLLKVVLFWQTYNSTKENSEILRGAIQWGFKISAAWYNSQSVGGEIVIAARFSSFGYFGEAWCVCKSETKTNE